MHKIRDDIYWTGYIDWDLRNFHGYSTPSGSTYNAYLVMDEKPTLIDTVKHYGYTEMLRRIKRIIDPAKIEYIISNHTEMDHSGTIGEMLKLCPNARIVCSPKGAEGLKRHFLNSGHSDIEWKFKVVNTGDELDIGKRKLKFLLMPMVHWPDSMATYSPQDQILFPNDAFGQHLASSQRFVDQVGVEIALKEAEKYYANIVMPYGAQVLKVLEAVATLKLDMICPSHGLIWRTPEDIAKIIAQYARWAAYESNKQVIIVYDTMWHSTEKMALKLYEVIDSAQIPVKLVNLKTSDYSDAVTDIMRSKMVILGSAILNNQVLPSVGGFLTYLKGLKPKNRFGFTFGSYGWSKAGFKELESAMEECGIKSITEGQYMQFVPSEIELASLEQIVELIKKALAI
ncbi:MAG: FprA family A-type flavoprotein [Candidatus Omnitrophica bacterium]|nr:FprA family A-type flavoprotein [Candidatus Omnitrophota bacterium]